MSDNNIDLSKSSKLDELKRQLRERNVSRVPLTKQIQKERDRVNERNNYWAREIRDNWFIYFLLGVSALFTGMLGLFMGLAPHLTPSLDKPGQQNITFNTDAGHLLTALLYVVAFITITEGAFIVGKWKYHTREEGNNKQTVMMILVMVIAFISIIGTGWAGGTVVASTLGFLTEFREIPPWAQEWAVRIIPLLFGVYAVFFTIYWLSSEKAKMERIAKQERESRKLDHQFTMEMLEADLEEDALVAEAEALIDLLRKGRISRATYNAARRAKLSVPELEEQLGQDLNDDDRIGSRPMLPDNQAAKVNNLPWQCEYCGNRNPGRSSVCIGCNAERGTRAPVFVPPVVEEEEDAQPERNYHPVGMQPRDRGNGAADPTKRQGPR